MSSPYEVSVHHFMERVAWTVYSFLLIPPYPMFFINEGAPRVLFGRENEVFCNHKLLYNVLLYIPVLSRFQLFLAQPGVLPWPP